MLLSPIQALQVCFKYIILIDQKMRDFFQIKVLISKWQHLLPNMNLLLLYQVYQLLEFRVDYDKSTRVLAKLNSLETMGIFSSHLHLRENSTKSIKLSMNKWLFKCQSHFCDCILKAAIQKTQSQLLLFGKCNLVKANWDLSESQICILRESE